MALSAVAPYAFRFNIPAKYAFGFQLLLFQHRHVHISLCSSILNQLLPFYLPNFPRKLHVAATSADACFPVLQPPLFSTARNVLFTRWNIINYMRAFCHSSCVFAGSNSIRLSDCFRPSCDGTHALVLGRAVRPCADHAPFGAIFRWHAFWRTFDYATGRRTAHKPKQLFTLHISVFFFAEKIWQLREFWV